MLLKYFFIFFKTLLCLCQPTMMWANAGPSCLADQWRTEGVFNGIEAYKCRYDYVLQVVMFLCHRREKWNIKHHFYDVTHTRTRSCDGVQHVMDDGVKVQMNGWIEEKVKLRQTESTTESNYPLDCPDTRVCAHTLTHTHDPNSHGNLSPASW